MYLILEEGSLIGHCSRCSFVYYSAIRWHFGWSAQASIISQTRLYWKLARRPHRIWERQKNGKSPKEKSACHNSGLSKCEDIPTHTKDHSFRSIRTQIIVLVSQVRWADIEERRKQLKMRELGFIVGSSSNWIDQKADPFDARKALEKTKLIPNRLEAEWNKSYYFSLKLLFQGERWYKKWPFARS